MQPPCGKYGLTLTDNGEISAPYETVPNPQSHEVWRISTRRDRNQPAARLPQSRALRENPAILRVLSVNPGGGEYWSQGKWRREWDSNPRYGFPHTRFPSVRLKPLGHLSGPLLIGGAPIFARVRSYGGGISLAIYCALRHREPPRVIYRRFGVLLRAEAPGRWDLLRTSGERADSQVTVIYMPTNARWLVYQSAGQNLYVMLRSTLRGAPHE